MALKLLEQDEAHLVVITLSPLLSVAGFISRGNNPDVAVRMWGVHGRRLLELHRSYASRVDFLDALDLLEDPGKLSGRYRIDATLSSADMEAARSYIERFFGKASRYLAALAIERDDRTSALQTEFDQVGSFGEPAGGTMVPLEIFDDAETSWDVTRRLLGFSRRRGQLVLEQILLLDRLTREAEWRIASGSGNFPGDSIPGNDHVSVAHEERAKLLNRLCDDLVRAQGI